jgi:hypothetical protein
LVAIYRLHIAYTSSNHLCSILGCYFAVADPQNFANSIVPGTPPSTPISVSSTITIWQTGNLYLHLAALEVLCCLYSNPNVARGYLRVVACGDLIHVFTVYAGLGSDMFFDVANWTGSVWVHVGITTFLFANRVATLAGLFGVAQEESMKQD